MKTVKQLLIKSTAPKGATHYDGMDYWKNGGKEWYIWLESCNQWMKIIKFKKFHNSFPIKPL